MSGLRDNQLKRLGWILHATGLAVVGVFLAGMHLFVVTPLNDHHLTQVDRAEELRRLLRRANEQQNHYAELNRTLRELRELAEAVHARIPERADETKFLARITEAARELGMEIQNFRRGQPVHTGTHSELTVRFTTEGNYDAIVRFLDQLMTLPRVVTIKELKIDAEPDRKRYGVDLNLALYFNVQPADVSAAQEAGRVRS